MTSKKTFPIIVFLLILLTACSKETKDSPISSQISPQLEITYCNIDPSELCLEGFGEESENKSLILLKADNPDFADISIGIQKGAEEVLFQCAQSTDFPENIYCSGEYLANGKNISLNIYRKKDNTLIAKGEFTIQYGVILKPDDAKITDFSGNSLSANYPNYPNYPNSSYQNP